VTASAEGRFPSFRLSAELLETIKNGGGNVIASPQQLAIVAQVLEAYSIAFSVDDPAKRENIADLLMMLFERGARTQAELAAAIEREIERGFLR
jgi:hypothetical protein